MDNFLLFVLVVFVIVALYLHADETEEEIERLEGLIEEQEQLIMTQYDYINDLQFNNEKVFDKLAAAINDNKINKIHKSDLAFRVEELVNQYLEVHDER